MQLARRRSANAPRAAACRELLDDIGRRRADRAANEREYIVMRNGGPSLVRCACASARCRAPDVTLCVCCVCVCVGAQVQSQYIAVGDVVCVREDQEFPCDLVVLSTSDKAGNCYIQVRCSTSRPSLPVAARRRASLTAAVTRADHEPGW